MVDFSFRQGLRFSIDNTHFRLMKAVPEGVKILGLTSTFQKALGSQVMVVYAFNSSVLEAEAGGSL